MEQYAIEALRAAASLSLPFVEAARMTMAPLAAVASDGDGSAGDGAAVDEAVEAWRRLVRTSKS